MIAVPIDSGITSIDDLAKPGVDLIIGTENVPFGSYTREALDRLPEATRGAILANVRSEESDVKGAVGKLSQGAADAAFTYASDVAAASNQLRAIGLPASLRPEVAYSVAVVKDSANVYGARTFVEGLSDAEGRKLLGSAGFGPPPGQ